MNNHGEDQGFPIFQGTPTSQVFLHTYCQESLRSFILPNESDRKGLRSNLIIPELYDFLFSRKYRFINFREENLKVPT